ncbi:unnamed protein product [Effrenium voratum]|uniref:Uncharacterized protein n=1 Tax=Effrenium voratum TaxID=2562239 RepID=A0AA36N8T3_9DINO|nr:unnamed protein product [Effrenium voratum]
MHCYFGSMQHRSMNILCSPAMNTRVITSESLTPITPTSPGDVPEICLSDEEPVSFGDILAQIQVLQEKLSAAHDVALQSAYEGGAIPPELNFKKVQQQKVARFSRRVHSEKVRSRRDVELPPTSRTTRIPSPELPGSTGGQDEDEEGEEEEDRRRGQKVTSKLAKQARRMISKLEEHARGSVPSQLSLRREWDIGNEDLMSLKTQGVSATSRTSSKGGQGGTDVQSRFTLQLHPRPENPLPPCMLHADSPMLKAWSAIALLVSLFDALITPLQAFDAAGDCVSWILYGTMWFWICDMLVTLRTAVQTDDRLLSRQADIAKNYAKTWLCFDALVVLPDLFAFMTWLGGGGADLESTAGTSTARIIRKARFLRVLRYIFRALSSATFGSFGAGPSCRLAFVFLRLGFLVAFAIHLLACVWFRIGCAEEDTWVKMEELEKETLWRQYTRSVQWALSHLPPSAMSLNMALNTETERWVSLMASGIACASGPIFISILTNTMADMRRKMKQQEQTCFSVRKYCEFHNIGGSYVSKIKRYVLRESQRQQAETEMKLVQAMPEDLVQELFHTARSMYLCRHALFDKIGQEDHGMEVQLCNQAISETQVMAGDMIFLQYAAAKGMYIVANGSCEYFSRSFLPQMQPPLPSLHSLKRVAGSCWQHYKKLFCCEGQSKSVDPEGLQSTMVGAGEYISEQAIWIQKWKHPGRLEASTDTIILLLQTEKMNSVLQDYPRILAETVAYARVFLEAANRVAVYPGLTDLPITNEEGTDPTVSVSVLFATQGSKN